MVTNSRPPGSLASIFHPLLCSLFTVDWRGRQPLSSLLLTSPGHHSQQTLLLPRFMLTTEEQATQRYNRCDLGYNRPLMGSALPPCYVFNHNGQTPLEKISLPAGISAECRGPQSKNLQNPTSATLNLYAQRF